MEQSGRSKSSDHAVDPSAASVKESDWKSTAYTTTKLAINLVKESSDVFPPLKSVMGGLSAILDHCDVRYTQIVPPMILTAVLANNGVSPKSRVFGASSRTADRINEKAHYRG